MAKSYVCAYCKKGVPTLKGMSSHISQRPDCRDALRRLAKRRPPQAKSVDPEEDQSAVDMQMEVDEDQPMIFESGPADEGASPPHNPASNRRTTMEEVEDEEAGGFRRYVEDYGEDGDAGKGFGEGQSQFAQWREAQTKAGLEPWAPFENLEEWDLAQWLLLNAGQNATDKFLKLPIVSKHHTVYQSQQ